jgi:protein-tyrosine phosphatase
MIEMACDDGGSHIFATPHILKGVHNNSSQTIISSLNNFKNHVNNGMEVLYGADVRISNDLVDLIERKEIPTLNGSGYLLLELPFYVMPPNIEAMIFSLRQKGIIPILAHPERYPYLMRNPQQMKRLRDIGVLYQVTAASLTGGFGRDICRVCFSMIKEGIVDFVASDAHNSKMRPPILSKAYREIKREFDEVIADRLFFHNPRKILGESDNKKASQWAMKDEQSDTVIVANIAE